MDYKVRNIEIYGIINPLLNIDVDVSKKCRYVIIKTNNRVYKKIDVNIITNKFKLSFINITEKLPKITQKISVEVIVDDKEVTLYQKKYSYLYRLFKVIKKPFVLFSFKLYVLLFTLARNVKYVYKKYHFLVPPKDFLKCIKKIIHDYKSYRPRNFYNPQNQRLYLKWRKENFNHQELKELEYKPLVSIILPIIDIDEQEDNCIYSILNQVYDNYELLIVTSKINQNYIKNCNKARYITSESNNMSELLNLGIQNMKGKYFVPVNSNIMLEPNFLYECVSALYNNKKIDFIYVDDDRIDLNGKRCNPHLKPDFSPDTLLSFNYIGYTTFIKKDLIEKVGLYDSSLNGVEDYDINLKCTEKAKNIHHISKILFSNYKIDANSDLNKKAIKSALKRRGESAEVILDEMSNYHYLKYEIKDNPLVSIIIPTKDQVQVLRKCIESICSKSTYKNYEIIIVDNASVEKETNEYLNESKKNDKITVLNYDKEFNYSKINNYAVQKAKGEYIVLLNNDTEIISEDWLESMLGYASRGHIGAVGAKLFYFDNTIQHVGVVLGLGGVASHVLLGAGANDPGIFGRMRVPYNYSAVTAACLMVSKKKYLEVNGLDENLKVAYNDVDFNIKLLENGYYNIVLPQTKLYHYESKSRGYDTSGEKLKRFMHETEIMNKKWPNQIRNDKFYNSNYSKKGWFVLDGGSKK